MGYWLDLWKEKSSYVTWHKFALSSDMYSRHVAIVCCAVFIEDSPCVTDHNTSSQQLELIWVGQWMQAGVFLYEWVQ